MRSFSLSQTRSSSFYLYSINRTLRRTDVDRHNYCFPASLVLQPPTSGTISVNLQSTRGQMIVSQFRTTPLPSLCQADTRFSHSMEREMATRSFFTAALRAREEGLIENLIRRNVFCLGKKRDNVRREIVASYRGIILIGNQ